MELNLKVNLEKLYYIKKAYAWDRLVWNAGKKKIFVRVGKFENDKLVGSELYCCSKGYALLFDNIEEATRFKNMYEARGEIGIIDLALKKNERYVKSYYSNGNVVDKCLRKYNYKGINCYMLEEA